MVSLRNWEFYWQKLYSSADFKRSRTPVPNHKFDKLRTWNNIDKDQKYNSFGYATYRTVIRNSFSSGSLGIRIPAPFSAVALFINGRQIATTGTVGTSRETEISHRKSLVAYFESTQPNIEVILHVSNHATFKGGLRGSVQLGRANEIRKQRIKNLAIDMFSAGIILAILAYHLIVYMLTTSTRAHLIFSFLALLYLAMALFYGEQSISFLFTDMPLEVHIRIGHMLLALIPPFILIFLYSIYRSILNIRVIYFFAMLSTIFTISLAFPIHIFTKYNIYYFILGGVGSCLVAAITTGKAVHRKLPGSRILMAGFISLTLFTMYSAYLHKNDLIAGGFVSMGFSIFALFQAGALASRHAGLEKANRIINRRLSENLKVLQRQRKEIEMNLHDSLGGNLTDMKLALQNMVRSYKKDYPEILPALEKIVYRTDLTIRSMRTQLLFLEDLELAMQDLVSGLRLILLRRYQDAGRKVHLEIPQDLTEKIMEIDSSKSLSDLFKLNLILVVQEVCTNNMKYTESLSRWEFNYEDNQLKIKLYTDTKQNNSSDENVTKGYGEGNIAYRLQAINGSITENTDNNIRTIIINVPLKIDDPIQKLYLS